MTEYGQVYKKHGAQRAKNGRSFLCLRSTFFDKSGVRQSNIVPWLPEGSIVTTTKNYVMFVVSEWGRNDVPTQLYMSVLCFLATNSTLLKCIRDRTILGKTSLD